MQANQPTTSPRVIEPFAPATLERAGVPLRDVKWFSELSTSEKFRAIRHSRRGVSVIEKVRKFMAQAHVAVNNVQRPTLQLH